MPYLNTVARFPTQVMVCDRGSRVGYAIHHVEKTDIAARIAKNCYI
jgi:hypothetical protein